MEEIFAQQLEKCGTEYFDYFLLHNVNGIRYEREIKECHMFEHMQQWKKDGKIRHIGFSYHDSPMPWIRSFRNIRKWNLSDRAELY